VTARCAFGGNMHAVDILLLIVSCLLIAIIVLQESKEDATQAFSGEKSDLFANKKERGIEVWISYITGGLSVAFIILSILSAFFVQRF
jgi:preprotein translocase subunit SecG